MQNHRRLSFVVIIEILIEIQAHGKLLSHRTYVLLSVRIKSWKLLNCHTNCEG
jgi:hypothetical protein